MGYFLKTRQDVKRIDQEVVKRTGAPTVNDDARYKEIKNGTLWIDGSAGTLYVCTDATQGAAVWGQVGATTDFSTLGLSSPTMYYVDFEKEDVTGADGSIDNPFNTLLAAVNQRDTDNYDYAIIKCYGKIGERQNLDAASDTESIPTGTSHTVIDFSDCGVTSLNKTSYVEITDRINLVIRGYEERTENLIFKIAQTGITSVNVKFQYCKDLDFTTGTGIADASYIILTFDYCLNTQVDWVPIGEIEMAESQVQFNPPITALRVYGGQATCVATGSTASVEIQGGELRVNTGFTFTCTGNHINNGGHKVEVGTGTYVISGTSIIESGANFV
jgi:hypothetical protein